ncbi:MAG: hypothetical protein CVV10_07085 [Gammaproteobacteria bacterium HGW-Gammaproteobacteria-14]|nr:MAG: hypothetical protein CVV10_07085 [Gammaproteobacteria bacterium HGW-Gammaproteobacteria-14]
MQRSRTMSLFVTLCFLSVQLWLPAHAALMSSSQAIAEQHRVDQQARIIETFQRDELATLLGKHGVDSQQLGQRLDRLTDQEIAKLAAEIDQLPAGEGVLGVVLAVFLILILLDLLGVTNIFPAIQS